MLNSKGVRELAYVVKIEEIRPIPNYDRVEYARTEGWWVVVKKDQFKVGDYAIYFEIDSKVPEKEPFMFLESKHFKIKTQKMCKVISQGLLMGIDDFKDEKGYTPSWVADLKADIADGINIEHEGLTDLIGVEYASKEDNIRKSDLKSKNDKYKRMAQRKPKLFKKSWARWMMKRKTGKKIMFFFFGKKKDKKDTNFPVGKFEGVNKTDQERIENMTWVLEDKTPFTVTQKCDGTSGTFILERKLFGKYEFYVCSRNVRMLEEDQGNYFQEENPYWEVAIKYNIKEKMKNYLEEHPNCNFVAWQGEICGSKIQGNPHKLKENHLFCFHWTDSENGRLDISEAKKLWEQYNMEVVPIVNTNYILPDSLEDFKKEADGFYDPSVCGQNTNCPREGYVYYKNNDPTFSFKNVSRQYLLKH